jgi:hypothetical protein
MREGQLTSLIILLNFAIAFPVFGEHATDTADFVLVKTVRGINLYERWHMIVPGELAREVKAVFTVDAEMGDVASLIKNEALALEWNKNTKVYNVEPGNYDGWICYLQYDLPWPVSNQDCVLKYSQHSQADKIHIYFNAIEHPLFPLRDGVDRIQDVKGKWVISRLEGHIKIEYYITTTPSKTLPRWITDPIIRNNLTETMRAFRQLLEGE